MNEKRLAAWLDEAEKGFKRVEEPNWDFEQN
jgi:hypothetical protein